MSLFDDEFPVIETFTDGEDILPVAYLHGLPMPYNVFILYLATRMAPQRTKGQMEKLYENGQFMLPSDGELLRTWERCTLPPGMAEKVAAKATASLMVRLAVVELFKKVDKTDTDEAKDACRDLINRIEANYASSLISPERI